MSDKTILTGEKFNATLCRVLGLEEPRVKRIVIDSTFGEVVHVLVEYVGDARLLDLDLTTLLKDASIAPTVRRDDLAQGWPKDE